MKTRTIPINSTESPSNNEFIDSNAEDKSNKVHSNSASIEYRVNHFLSIPLHEFMKEMYIFFIFTFKRQKFI